MTATETRDTVTPSEEQAASQTPPLEGCALVTGASRGIGAAIARKLSEAGWPVAINYRSDREGAERVAGEIGDRGATALAIQADVTDPDGAEALLAEGEGGRGGV